MTIKNFGKILLIIILLNANGHKTNCKTVRYEGSEKRNDENGKSVEVYCIDSLNERYFKYLVKDYLVSKLD